eukprot:CAMPEP_0179094372 /NCGR_PEP_ID=MMETSP0796-20121207/43277_1 /TAXON_ID=73915 /ORGANISM="Pyrodinium bahamense, Strain pbaha01" /LENGTH=295 /DNA_ID=CAMNT_0020792043 /DNA_START=65 /DNA_END=952 /DNA_ORIENTATION=-
MDRSRCVVALALVGQLLSLVGYAPSFTSVAPKSPTAVGAGAAGQTRSLRDSSRAAGAGARLQAATAALTVGAIAAGLRGASQRRASARARIQVRADASGLIAGGPITVYTNALMDAATKKEEAVQVTKDVMKIKSLFLDEPFLDELTLVVNEVGQTELDKAKGMIKLFQPLESTVMEKFITFLAKKRRLLALKPICKEYVASLYDNQSIAPVVVRSAQRLSEEQMNNIKEKMKAKTGAADIKLVTEVDAGLLGGFIIEWGFTDPENLATPTEGIDLSLKNYLRKSAINQGVITEV